MIGAFMIQPYDKTGEVSYILRRLHKRCKLPLD